MLIVCSLEHLKEACEKFHPKRVVSLLDESAGADECVRASFPGVAPGHHLKLIVGREACAKSISETGAMRAAAIIDEFINWDGQGNVLIHCEKGVARSMGAAFIIACMVQPDRSEAEIAAEMRSRAPHADPCVMIVAHADELLGREGRMADAVYDLPPPCPTTSAPIVTLPIAA